MDRKSILVLTTAFVVLFGWLWLVPRLYPPIPVAPGSTNTFSNATSTNGSTDRTAAPVTLSSGGSTNPVVTPTPEQPERLVTLSTEDAVYTFTSAGGGLKRIDLKHYAETVDCRKDKGRSGDPATLNAGARWPLLALLGGEALAGDGAYTLKSSGDNVLLAEKQLSNGLYISKRFELASNYLISATVRIENRSQAQIALPSQQYIAGTATPIGLHDNEQLMGVYWFNGTKEEHIQQGWFENRTLGCFKGTPRTEFRAGANNVSWSAVHNQFFTIGVLTPTNGMAREVMAYRVELPVPTEADIARDPRAERHPHGYEARLVYEAQPLDAGATLERQFTIYAGPKEYRTLSKIPGDLDLVMSFGGFFGWFAKVLLLSMNGFHSLGLSYGLAIVAITVIIKTLFWPLTQASTRSMKRMQALQPQMKALQEKYKGDPAKMNKKLMEFMKENKVSPLGGCLPMLLQIPVFFGFFRMIQSAIELRGAGFLWACDLSQPDTVAFIPGLNFPINPFPLIMGVTMLWQARLTPPSPGMDPMQQKIMRYMPLMFMVFLYNFSAGLTLYWTVQNLLTILQMKLTKTEPLTPGSPTTPAAPALRRKK